MQTFKPLSELRMDNWKAEEALSAKDSDPVWRYFGQARAFLYPLERVCGAEKEIDAMRRNGAEALRGRAGVLQVVAAATLLLIALL
jgi:hypothetical protein